MFPALKMYFSYLLVGSPHAFVENYVNNSGNSNLLIKNSLLFYVSLHIKLASNFYTHQLVDMYAYEVLLPTYNRVGSDVVRTGHPTQSNQTTLVYNFQSLRTGERYFIFVPDVGVSSSLGGISTLSDLFYSANWLEREASELHGVYFLGKKDIRNLLLQYGDSSTPFQKSSPTIGLSEVCYNPIKDVITQNMVSVQI